MTKEEIKYSMI